MASPSKEAAAQLQQSLEASYTEMEGKMREQIKLLQEQRAAAIMNEMIDLQKERDIALSRIKMLKKSVENLTVENELLRSMIGQEKLADRFMLLEQSLLEEQLLTKDLRKKLDSVNKHNATQELKIRKLELELAACKQSSPKTPTSAMIRLSVESDLVRERSHSMNDLTGKDEQNQESTSNNQRSGSPRSASGSVKRLKHKRVPPPLLTITPSNSSPMFNSHSTPGSPTQPYSPTVVARRYKLAAVVSRDIGVQTHSNVGDSETDHRNTGRSDDGNPHTSGQAELARLQQEKQDLEIRLSEEFSKRDKDREKHKRLRKDCQVLQTECSVLRDSLTEFTRWVRQKIQLAEEDMDIFRVVYSLHGSLSQESETLNHLQGKLAETEQKVQHLEATNRILNEMCTQADEKYNQSQKQIELLKEKLSLLSPTSSPSKKRLSTSPKLHHRAIPIKGMKPVAMGFGTNGRSANKHSSPLLRKSSPLVSSGHERLTAKENKNVNEGNNKNSDVNVV